MHGRLFDHHLRPFARALVLVGSFGCAHTAGVEPSSAAIQTPPSSEVKPSAAPKGLPLQAPPPPASASLGEVMGDHFAITSWARDSVIAGLLPPLREPLIALADYHYDEVQTGGWLPWIAELQEAARLTSKAATLDAAAMGVATMARVCGECHRANHAGPAIPAAGDPLERRKADTVEERMARHMWASELLWEGLTGPSDVTWRAGVKVLLEAPDALDEAMPQSFDADLQQVRVLSQNAEAADSLADRANVYGLLIATCADCHTRWIQHGKVAPPPEDEGEDREWNNLEP